MEQIAGNRYAQKIRKQWQKPELVFISQINAKSRNVRESTGHYDHGLFLKGSQTIANSTTFAFKQPSAAS